MGTVLQERVPLCPERVLHCGGEWGRTPWSNNRPGAASNKMVRRQLQRKSLQAPNTFSSQDNNHFSEKRPPQRRRHRANNPLTKCNIPQPSAHKTPDAMCQAASNVGDRKVSKLRQCGEQRHPESRRIRHAAATPHRPLSNSSPDLLQSQNPIKAAVNPSGGGEQGSDSDLSDSEKLPLPTGSPPVPPQLNLRPEVVNLDDLPSDGRRARGQGRRVYPFPDFLPPPFNSWSLSQLAVFYNMEGRGQPRPRPVGPLERYLERLLQLEWHRIQMVQEDSGSSDMAEVLASCRRPHAAQTSRLSSPKSILQCQRAFPLTFLSSLASHSAMLTSCACTVCRLRYASCGLSCCRSAQSHTAHSRLSPLLECRGPVSLPKRSYSETRVRSSDKVPALGAYRLGSPVRGNSHLRRMQASGNIRNPVQGATAKPHLAARNSVGTSAQRDCLGEGDVWSRVDRRPFSARYRSGSEQRRGGTEKRREGSERRRSGSECGRVAVLHEQEVKPDAVAAILDNLPASKRSSRVRSQSHKSKQVEFVT